MLLIWLTTKENRMLTRKFLSGLWVKARMARLNMFPSINSTNLFRSVSIAMGMSQLPLPIISLKEFHSLRLLIRKLSSCLLLKTGSPDTKMWQSCNQEVSSHLKTSHLVKISSACAPTNALKNNSMTGSLQSPRKWTQTSSKAWNSKIIKRGSEISSLWRTKSARRSKSHMSSSLPKCKWTVRCLPPSSLILPTETSWRSREETLWPIIAIRLHTNRLTSSSRSFRTRIKAFIQVTNEHQING